MKKRKLLFVINTLRDGGAERILVDLLRNLPPDVYEIELRLISRKGPFIKDVPEHIKVSWISTPETLWAKLVSHLLPRLPSSFLHWLFIHGDYDVEIAFLEGYATKIVAGAPDRTHKVSWLHTNLILNDWIAPCFRSHEECLECYRRFEHIVCVSRDAFIAFTEKYTMLPSLCVRYNPIDVERIRLLASKEVEIAAKTRFRLVSIGRLVREKSFDRLLRVATRLASDGIDFELFILGEGPQRGMLEDILSGGDCLHGRVFLTGFKANPYPLLKSADLFVCSSVTEGYSTAVAEALVLGVPVVTTNCTGMRELLDNGKYGLVTENSEDGLEDGLRIMLESPARLAEYRNAINQDPNRFSMEQSIKRIRELFDI